MNNEKDIYIANRIKKMNVNLKEEEIKYEKAPSSLRPVVRKPKPTYNRQFIPDVEKPSSPHQSKSIEERTTLRQTKDTSQNENKVHKDSSSYSRPASNPRQVRPTEPIQARPTDPKQVRPALTRPTNPKEVRPALVHPTNPRQTSPNQSRPGYGNVEVNRVYATNQRKREDYESRKPSNYQSRQHAYYNERYDIYENKSTPSKKGSGFTGFKKFITIYSAILLVIVVAVVLVLSSFLKNYEKNQPNVLAANIASSLSEDSASYLDKNKDKISCLENVDAIIEKVSAQIGENKVSYIENRDYRADAPSYDFTVEENTIAKVTFEKAKKGAFGLNTWKIKSIDVAEYIPDTLSFTLYAPEGTTVSVNDHVIDDNYKTADAEVPEHLQQAARFTDITPYVTYKVSGFTNAPSVKATDANGNEIKTTMTTDTIVVGANTPQEFVDEVKPIVDDAIEAWAKYFVNYGGRLRYYVYDYCDWFKYIFGGDDIYPITPQFYESDSIASVEFPVKESKNYIKYSDKCFSVDVKYEMKVNFTTDIYHDENQKLDATWVWYYADEYNQWSIVDCIYK